MLIFYTTELKKDSCLVNLNKVGWKKIEINYEIIILQNLKIFLQFYILMHIYKDDLKNDIQYKNLVINFSEKKTILKYNIFYWE